MTHLASPPPVRPPRARLSAAVLPVLAGLAACDAVDRAPNGWHAEFLDTPFLEAAGMPHLSPAEDGAVLSWWAPVDGAQELRVARWTSEFGFGPARPVVSGDDFFVNWADFPSVVEVAPGKWVAHWLQRSGDGTYAYGVRVAVSEDGGVSWSEAWTPHADESPTEHGFVSIWPDGEGAWSLVWLDGRKYAEGPHGPASQEMTVRARSVALDGTPGPEAELDHRACDCCQTDVAATRRGAVVVYRDRTDGEVRDIYLSRREASGWTQGRPVHADGWVIGGCPVNGPAVDAHGDAVVVAWFTGADDRPRVQVAFSADAGDSFQDPVRVDDGRPVGRVDVVRLADGAALVAWLEEADGPGAQIRLRRVEPDGALGDPWTLAETSAARGSGFPQFIALPEGGFLAAWTEVREEGPSAIRVARVEAS